MQTTDSELSIGTLRRVAPAGLRRAARLSLFALLLAAPAQAQPTHKIVATDHQTVSATITYEIKTTNFAVTRWMIFLPEPPELPSQTKVKATTSPTAKVVAEKSPLERKVRFIDVPVANPAPGKGLALKLDVQAVLRARKLVPLDPGEKAPKVAPLTAAEQKYYTAPGSETDFDAKPFKEWLDEQQLKAKRDEPPLELAARVLEAIRAGYEYKFVTEDKRASLVCGRTWADCGGMSHMFVAALRANKVPARVLVGRFAKPRKDGVGPASNEYDQPHVRAEVYVAGVGWVPVDPAFAHGNKRKPVEAFIGNDEGDVLVLHADADLQLPYPDATRVAQSLQTGPHYWTHGKGTFDGTFGPTGWELKATPVKK